MAIMKKIPGDSVRQVSTATDELAKLRDIEAAALAATTSETGVELALTTDGACKCLIQYQGYSGYTAGSAEWEISLEVSDLVGGTYVSVGSVALDAGPGNREIAFTGKQVEDLLPDAAFARVTATKVGAAGDLTYAAYVIPVMV